MKIFFTHIFLLIAGASYCQELSVDAGYSYLYSRQFDELIHTYNFSRPFLEEKQPLLDQGIHMNFAYLFNSERKMRSGLAIDYSLFQSSASNPNLESKLAFNLVELGYFLKFQDREKFGNFYSEVGANIALGFLAKRINGEPLIVDEASVKSFQVGVSFNVNFGYTFDIGNKLKISPVIGVHASPYFWEGNSEVVINQTSELLTEQYTSFFKFDAAVRFILPISD